MHQEMADLARGAARVSETCLDHA